MHSVWRTCNKIRATLSRIRANLWDCFVSFDTQGNHLISEQNFIALLSGPLGKKIGLSNQEICELADYFRTQDGRIFYAQFCAVVHENNPQFESNFPFTTGQEWEDALQTNCLSLSEQRRLEIILSKIASIVNWRKHVLKPYFQDYELISKNCGVVSYAHFARVLYFLDITLAAEEMNLLIKKFAKDSYTVNYVAFIKTIEEIQDFLKKHECLDKGGDLKDDFPGRIIEVKLPKLPRPEIGKIKTACVFPKQLHFLPLDPNSKRIRDIQEIMLRLQEHALKNRIRVAQYFQDYDVFNVGRITKNQFERGLDEMRNSGLGKLYLAPEEIENLIAFYKDPNDMERICWRTFEDDIEQVALSVALPTDVFSCMKIADKISLNVQDETFGSDHFPIILEVETQKHLYSKHSYRLKSTRTDWEKIETNLDNMYSSFFSSEYNSMLPSKKYEHFVYIIFNAIIASTPRKNYNKKKQTQNLVPWWDDDCNRIKRIRRASLKKWEFTNNLIDLIEYNKNCALATQLFKKKERIRKKNASPGLDGLDYECLQNLPEAYKLLLRDIFNEMYVKTFLDVSGAFNNVLSDLLLNKLASIKCSDQLAAQKTALIHFNNNNILPGSTKILIQNYEIKSKDYTRFLGNKYILKTLSNKNNLMYKQLLYLSHHSTRNRKKRILTRCIENMTEYIDLIDTHDNFVIYTHDYNTNITSIPFNKSLGQKLAKEKNPNVILKSFPEKHKILDIYTDGSKILGNPYVGSACTVPNLKIDIWKSSLGATSVLRPSVLRLIKQWTLQ
ncbi:hypothetical protein TSAR_003806 [Trichomalopsis sarcophagae]|uniref:EF-hand domain-containing protein n=1 Tax=Trichomalopsis sarcophagae TaxID=543379 RepID=A0A232ENS2_9HYME|nr:hypothetical protein TSAR_003806 [Trichomalopsis sarcophagae]